MSLHIFYLLNLILYFPNLDLFLTKINVNQYLKMNFIYDYLLIVKYQCYLCVNITRSCLKCRYIHRVLVVQNIPISQIFFLLNNLNFYFILNNWILNQVHFNLIHNKLFVVKFILVNFCQFIRLSHNDQIITMSIYFAVKCLI